MSNEITTPYDRVLIDPNEPLILPDGTAITGRLETFLYALCCLDYDNLPTPLSRIEEFANALITGEIPNIEPQSRSEQFFLAILDGNIDNLPEPQSRSEVLLNKLAVGDFDLTNIDPIQSRYELLLAYLIKNGGVGNIDYVLYEFYQATQTLYNTQEKPVKSAILKGQTLVNVSGEPIVNLVINSSSPKYLRQHILKKDTVYTFIYDIEEVTGDASGCWGRFNYTDGSFKNVLDKVYTTGTTKVVTSFDKDLHSIYIGWIRNHAVGQSVKFKSVMILEGDWTDKELPPYFDGMASCKMPVLKTTGKNLFDISKMPTTTTTASIVATVSGDTVKIESIRDTGACYWTSLSGTTITLKKGVNYWVSYDYTVSNSDQNMTLVDVETQTTLVRKKTTTDKNGRIIHQYCSDDRDVTICLRFYVATGTNGKKGGITTFSNIQIEQDIISTSTSYEPYKSNILTVDEDVILRGIGEVKDELNLLTGELTQRIETRVYQEGDESNSDVITDLTNTVYKLTTESVKTVDLSVIDQDGNVLPKIKTFNNITHVNVSSDGILPKVEMEVATYNEEDIANANVMTASMDEIYSVQNELDNTNSIQSEEIDSTMIASTEIYENIL